MTLFDRLVGQRCVAFHPRSYMVDRLLAGCNVVAHHPGGELPELVGQDLYIARPWSD